MSSPAEFLRQSALVESLTSAMQNLLGPHCEVEVCDARSGSSNRADTRQAGSTSRTSREQLRVELLADADYRVTFPVELGSAERLLVSGTITADSRAMAEKLALASREAANYLVKTEAQQLDVEAYAQQVTLDFEELHWLRTLAGYLDCCELSHDMVAVAKLVLPSLSQIIGAQQLVLVGTKSKSDPAPNQPSEVGAVLAAAGSNLFDDADCCRIVDLLRHAAQVQPAVHNHLQNLPEFHHIPGAESCIVVSVAHKGFCGGWLLAVNRVPHDQRHVNDEANNWCAYSEEEFGTVQAGLMSSAAAMLATHGRNFALLKEKEGMLIGVIRSLINALDAKDSYTCGHSDRVALIARRIGEELSLEPQECERLYMTGLLHDVGKIGVPDEVLLKPGKLTDEEFAQIKRHPTIGHKIMRHVEPLSYVLPGLLHHHESFDGQGYPCRLVGEQIPLAARILAVADSYDAMTSHRPYRHAMPSENAEIILRSGADKQWDGKVIAAFFRAVEDIRKIGDTSSEHTQEILSAVEPEKTHNINVMPNSIAAAVKGN